MVALLVFIMATLEKKKLLDAKGLFGDNVIKNTARYIEDITYFIFEWQNNILRTSAASG